MQHHLFAWQPQSIIGQVQFFLRLNETIESFWAIPKLHLVGTKVLKVCFGLRLHTKVHRLSLLSNIQVDL